MSGQIDREKGSCAAEPAAQADAPRSVVVLCRLGLGAPLSGIPLCGKAVSTFHQELSI
jgi:hypothetical protein